VITARGDETEEDHTAEDTTQDDETGSRATVAVMETIVELLMQRAAGGGGVVHQAEEMRLQVKNLDWAKSSRPAFLHLG